MKSYCIENKSLNTVFPLAYLGSCYEYKQDEILGGSLDEIYTSIGKRKSNGNDWLQISRDPLLLWHPIFMGTTLMLGKPNNDGSTDTLIVGLPYAWVGRKWNSRDRFDKDNRQRTVGTIGRIDISGNQISVPTPREIDSIVDNDGGAIWGSANSYYSTKDDPIESQQTGTSVAKGMT